MAGSGAVVRQRAKATDAYAELLQDPRTALVIELKAKHYSWRQIARLVSHALEKAPQTPAIAQLGKDPVTLLRLYRKHEKLRRQVVQFNVEHEIANEATGYDLMEIEAWSVLMRAKGDDAQGWAWDGDMILKAEDSLIRIKAARAKLLGLNSPDRVDVGVQVDGLGAYIASLRARSASVPAELLADSPFLLPAHAEEGKEGNGANGHDAPDADSSEDMPEPEPLQ